MKLTREQEEKLLLQYEPFIRSCVNEFAKRGRPDLMDNYDDFLQEARLAFLIQVRKRDTMFEVVRGRQRIKDAMYEYCRTMAPVHIPRKKYPEHKHRFSKISYDVVGAMETILVMTDDHVVGAAEATQFMESLSEDERTVLLMKEEGHTNREIIPIIHARNEPHMSRIFRRLQQKVLAFINGT